MDNVFRFIDLVHWCIVTAYTAKPQNKLQYSYQLCGIFIPRYTVLKEPTKSWGVDKDGVWDGLLGYVQREDVDMSTFVVPIPSSLKVATFMRSTPTGSAVIVSLKPQPLPRSLALIRPFSGMSINVRP